MVVAVRGPQVRVQLPVGEPAAELVGHPHREAGLADAALSRDRHDRHAVAVRPAGHQLPDLVQVPLPAGEVGDARGQLLGDHRLLLGHRRGGRALGHRGGARGGQRELRVAVEDRPLQVLQLLARLDAHLLDQRAARPAAHLQRLGLPARPVQREHQEPVQPFAQGVLLDERPQVAADLLVPAQLEVEPDQLLHGRQPPVLPQRGTALHEVARHTGERGPPPQRERAAQRRRGLLGAARVGVGARRGDQRGELQAVQLARGDLQQVAGRAGLDGVALARVGEDPAQRRDADLHLAAGRRRRGPVPHGVDELVHRDHPVGVQAQHRQDDPLPRAAEVERAPVEDELDRPEKSESHSASSQIRDETCPPRFFARRTGLSSRTR